MAQKIIDTLTGNVNAAGSFSETYGVLNASIWEHPDYPGWFVLTSFGAGGLTFAQVATKIYVNFTDLFNLAIASEPLLLPVLPTVTAAPSSGVHPQTVTLKCQLKGADVAGAQIRYTTDGSTPTAASALYSVPLNIAVALTLKAKAFKSPYWQSSVLASFVYT